MAYLLKYTINIPFSLIYDIRMVLVNVFGLNSQPSAVAVEEKATENQPVIEIVFVYIS